MNTFEIIDQLKELDCFQGVFPLDKLRNYKFKKIPMGIVINLDFSNEPGSHWVALYVNEQNEAIYFDSFGFINLNEYFLSFLKKNKIKGIIFNKFQIQSFTSDVCGAHCIIFLKMICNGFSFNEILSQFSRNKERNDFISSKIIEN